MKISYVERRFNSNSLQIIDQANEIIDSDDFADFDLTLRQLYYQFVAGNLLENTERNYKRLGSIISDARLAGLISWRAIEDRTRALYGNTHYESAADLLNSVSDQLVLDKWEDQAHKVEVWVEKEAMAEVVGRICHEMDVDYFCCRGYVSQSAMWRAARRIERNRAGHTTILHLGDHDPSGIDMTRDIEDRLRQVFRVPCLEVKRIALNMDQIEELNPPPNPAKLTDSRAASYVEEFGNESWELDALKPQYIMDLIEENILELRDPYIWKHWVDQEEEEKRKLEKAIENLRD